MRLRQLFEAPRAAVVAFGRMNPPTIGHQKLVDKIKSLPGDHYVFLSQTQKPKTDPLSFVDKLRYAKFFFPEVTIGNPEVRTIIQALQKINELGYENLIYVAGSDRVAQFEKLLNDYNGKDYTFKSIKVVSAGERDPDAEGAEGMSASKLKKLAAEGKLEDWTDETGKKQPGFRSGVPKPEVADEMFNAVRKGMGVRDEVPAEGINENTADQEWYVLTANSGDRLQGPIDSNSATQQALVYPKKPPQIGPAPQGFKTIIAQGKGSSMNLALRKAELNLKKIYAKQFPNGQQVRINMDVFKKGGRAIDSHEGIIVATVSAHIKIQSEIAEKGIEHV